MQQDNIVPCVLAIDPGRQKCGMAVVGQNGEVRTRQIVAVENLGNAVLATVATFSPVAVVCGNGTGSKPILKLLRETATLPIIEVDESHTSEEARARFVRENSPPLLQRLLPRSLRTPWCPYDDYVATILAERYWNQRQD